MSVIRSSTTHVIRSARNRWADLRIATRSPGSSETGPLPDFLIVGAMKTGTTSLSGNLKLHPRIYMTPREVRFFDQNWHQGLDWYRTFFREGAGKVCGEKTPEYMRVRRYMERIRHVVPSAKIIVLLREPVARLMSEINHRMHGGTLPAADLIDAGYIRKFVLADPVRGRRMLDRGFYLKQIRENVLSCFPRDQVLIHGTDESARAIQRDLLRAGRIAGQLTGDDDTAHTAKALNEICAFLEIEPFTGSEPFTFSGVRVHHATVTHEARKMIYDRYAEQNRRLFDLLGRDFPDWREEVAVGDRIG